MGWLLPAAAFAQVIWDGGAGDNRWGSGANWNPNNVPTGTRIEAELIDLPPEEAKAFLKDLGVDDSGVSALIKGTYALLGLQTYFTAGVKEVRCWTIK